MQFKSDEGIHWQYSPTLVADPADTPWPFFRGPSLLIMPDGRWLASLFTGGPTEPDRDNHAMVAESRDGGVTWEKPKVFFINHRRRAQVSTLFSGFDRPLAIVNTLGHDTYTQEVRAHVSWYDADQDGWTVPAVMPGCQAVRSMRGFTAANGTAIFPAFWAEGADQSRPSEWTKGLTQWQSDLKLVPVKREYRHVCGIVTSQDGGKSFRQKGHVSHPDVSLWEPTVTEIEPGHLVMLMRAEGAGFLYRSHSQDSGETWSAPEATDIVNPNTKPVFAKIGRSILLFHNPTPGNRFVDRNQLEVWVSHDGLKSWDVKLPLAYAADSGRPVCYPHPLFVPERDEVVTLVDTARKVYLLRIPLADLGVERSD